MKVKKKRSDWILTGLSVLREKGINAVRIETLAKKMGVTKGGFYGYFLQRDALLQAMLEHWETELTDRVISDVRKIRGSLSEKVLKLLEMVDGHSDESVDLSMTSWSFRDQRTRTVVNRVVRNRIDFMKNLFLNDGFTEEQAELRARLAHSFIHGDRSFPDTCEKIGSPERKKMIKAFAKLLCTR